MDLRSNSILEEYPRTGFTPYHFFSKSGKGFTLIEMIIAAAIVVALFATGLIFTVNDYRGSTFRGEAETLATLLETARGAAMNNIDGQPHGVAIHPTDHPQSYVLFAGPSYAASTQIDVIDHDYAISIESGSLSEIVFAQLSGDVATDGEIVLLDEERGMSFDIAINAEGRIDW